MIGTFGGTQADAERGCLDYPLMMRYYQDSETSVNHECLRPRGRIADCRYTDRACCACFPPTPFLAQAMAWSIFA